MRWIKWTGIASAIILTAACFYPWVLIESRNFIVTGVNAENIHLGKPAYFHFVLTFLFLLFTFIPRIWAKRSNLLIVALNLGWTIRNYLIITACQGGECPVKQTAIYFIIPASLLMMIAALFPDVKMKNQNLKSQP